MFDISSKIKSNFSGAAIAKQARFATAVSLTQTAKDGQKEVLQTLPQTFTIRGNWSNPSNKFGIRIKSAKKNDLQSAVMSNADWLIPHETGDDKTPRGNSLAIPTVNVRRNKKDIIIKCNRPRNLKKAFVLTTKNGNRVLTVRQGRGKKKTLKFLYNLTAKARIRKQSTFFQPIEYIVKTKLLKNYEVALRKALTTAK